MYETRKYPFITDEFIDSIATKILRILGKHYTYYVYGGKALSKIFKKIKSKDWDIVIVYKNEENIDDIIKYIEKLIKFHLEYKLDVDVEIMSMRPPALPDVVYDIYRFSIKSKYYGSVKYDIFDVKFSEERESEIMQLNNIYYMDISGLYKKLHIAIQNSEANIYTTILNKNENILWVMITINKNNGMLKVLNDIYISINKMDERLNAENIKNSINTSSENNNLYDFSMLKNNINSLSEHIKKFNIYLYDNIHILHQLPKFYDDMSLFNEKIMEYINIVVEKMKEFSREIPNIGNMFNDRLETLKIKYVKNINIDIWLDQINDNINYLEDYRYMYDKGINNMVKETIEENTSTKKMDDHLKEIETLKKNFERLKIVDESLSNWNEFMDNFTDEYINFLYSECNGEIAKQLYEFENHKISCENIIRFYDEKIDTELINWQNN